MSLWLAEVTSSPSGSPLPGTGGPSEHTLLAVLAVVTLACLALYWITYRRRGSRPPGSGTWV